MIGIIIPTKQEYDLIDKEFLKNKFVKISGVGKIKATITAMEMIVVDKIKTILCIGTCGALDKTKIGSIIMPTKYYQGDMDLTALGYRHGESFEEKTTYITPKLPKFLEINKEESICSSDKLIKKEEDKIFIKENFSNYVDMESFAIAKVCIYQNVNFGCIRVVSDSEEKLGEWEQNLHFAMGELNKTLTRIKHVK